MGGTINPAQTLQSERLRFPGMLPRDIIVWRNWLMVHEREYERWDYNVRVGTGFDPGPTWPDYVRRQAVLNSQKRIDAVAYQASVPTLFEVKDRAGLSAFGQIIAYRLLFSRTFPGLPDPKLVMVTHSPALDLIDIARQHDVAIFVVPADFSELRARAGHRHPRHR